MFPKHLIRLSRIFDHLRPFYFVTFNTENRAHLLASPEIHEAFLEYCRGASDRQIYVGRYVLMPDHIHLFVVLPEQDITLSSWVHGLKVMLGKRLQAMGHAKPRWQRGFFDHLMRSAESYSEEWEYVRMNPVRAGLCSRPEEWPFQGEVEWLEY